MGDAENGTNSRKAPAGFLRAIWGEVLSLNFYVYGQWCLLVTLLGSISLTLLLIVRAAQGQSLLDTSLWWALVGPINGTVIAIIIWFHLVEPETTRRIKHEDLAFGLFWTFVTASHVVACRLVTLYYLIPTIPLGMAALCYLVAYALCQSHRKTRLTGGSGVDHMMLVVPRNYQIPDRVSGRLHKHIYQ